jgi:hypothetical protein
MATLITWQVRILPVFLSCLLASTQVSAGEDTWHDALVCWTFGPEGAVGPQNALEAVGAVEFVELTGEEKVALKARGGTGWVARLNGGHLDAGRHLNLTGDACTVYLRVRDPGGAWEGGLFSKRGSHEIVNFNLFAANGRIGGEFHGESAALGSVAFPSEGAVGNGWHDLVLRYDGQTIDIFCDGAPMAAVAWTGGSLTQNDEPLLIGAESVNGSPVRPFRGDVEKAALWSRALTDEEIAAISPSR